MSNESTPPESPEPAEKTLVYGWLADTEYSLVFAPLSEAKLHFDLATCKDFPMTWGEFRRRFGEAAYERFAAHLIENASYSSFEEFIKDYDADEWEQLPAEQAYADLPCGEGGRPPADHDAAWFFDGNNDTAVPGSLGWWPAQDMLEWLPREIIKKYGGIVSTRLDGEYVELDKEREAEIIADLEALGYTCVENSRMLNVATGYA